MTKSFKTYYERRKRDEFYKLAKKLNIRARSYFKLKFLDKRYGLIKEGMTILDLGSAPGSWLQYLDKKLENGKIIGIDLLEINHKHEFSDKIKIIKDDFNNLRKYLDENEKFDLIISDMAPEFSGHLELDKGRTYKLNKSMLEFSDDYLKEGGNLLFKTFAGSGLKEIRELSKKRFKFIKEYKPKSSTMKSPELYIVCFNKLKNSKLKNG